MFCFGAVFEKAACHLVCFCSSVLLDGIAVHLVGEDVMRHSRLFLWSLLITLVCIAALIGIAMMLQDGIVKPHNEEAALTYQEK